MEEADRRGVIAFPWMPSGPGQNDASSAPAPGEVVAGQYVIERVLGQGGMGVVVAARDKSSGATVAVKLLRAAEDRRAVERFFREARAMGRLATEHVVRIIESGSDGKVPYLVMEQLDGIDLAERSKAVGKLPVRDVVDAIIQACEALSHAHASGIVHRDVKPSNLFAHRGPDGRTVVKMLDFGISKMKSREEWEMTLTTSLDGGVLGSPPYMSPEQVRDPKKVDARTDIWSLGIVMYRLLTGRLPFDGESVGEVFARVLERPYPSLRTWGGVDVPPEIDRIVSVCLAKERLERFQNVGALAMALAPFASPEWAALAPRIAERMAQAAPMSAVELGRPRPPPAEPGTLSLPPDDGAPAAALPPITVPIAALSAQGPTVVAPLPSPRYSGTIPATVVDPRPRSQIPTVKKPRPSGGANVVGGVALAIVAALAVVGIGVRVTSPPARSTTATSAVLEPVPVPVPVTTAVATAATAAATSAFTPAAPATPAATVIAASAPATPLTSAPATVEPVPQPPAPAPSPVTATPAAPPRPPTTTASEPRPRPPRKPTAPSTSSTSAGSRPELQPNPYGTP